MGHVVTIPLPACVMFRCSTADRTNRQGVNRWSAGGGGAPRRRHRSRLSTICARNKLCRPLFEIQGRGSFGVAVHARVAAPQPTLERLAPHAMALAALRQAVQRGVAAEAAAAATSCSRSLAGAGPATSAAAAAAALGGARWFGGMPGDLEEVRWH